MALKRALLAPRYFSLRLSGTCPLYPLLADSTHAQSYTNSSGEHSNVWKYSLVAGGILFSGLVLHKRGNRVLCESDDVMKEKTDAFTKRYTLNYENRIRMYSLPDKIFRYFASIQVEFPDGRTEVFMNPDDFVRSIIPNEMQPKEVDLDHFHKVKWGSPTLEALSSCKATHDTRFFHTLSTESNGLISLSEYIFLLTILMVPKRKLKLIFKAIDKSGDDLIEFEEFQQIQQLIRSNYSGLNVVSSSLNSTGGLGEYLFGKDRSKKLSLEQFENFYEDIHQDIIKMEFNIYKPVSGKLSEYNFSKFLINSCDFKQDKVEEYLERIETSFGKKLVTGIPYEEVEKLMIAVKDINEIDRALHMYFMGGLSIPQDEFKYVISCVTNIKLESHLVDVLFTLLDQDGDGMLSRKEFVRVIKRRTSRGFNKPRDFGFARAVSAVFECGKKINPLISRTD